MGVSVWIYIRVSTHNNRSWKDCVNSRMLFIWINSKFRNAREWTRQRHRFILNTFIDLSPRQLLFCLHLKMNRRPFLQCSTIEQKENWSQKWDFGLTWMQMVVTLKREEKRERFVVQPLLHRCTEICTELKLICINLKYDCHSRHVTCCVYWSLVSICSV